MRKKPWLSVNLWITLTLVSVSRLIVFIYIRSCYQKITILPRIYIEIRNCATEQSFDLRFFCRSLISGVLEKKKPWSPYKVVHFSKQKSWLIKYILRRVFALGCTQLRTFLSWRSALMVTKKWLWAIIIIFNLITRFSCKALNKRKQVLAWKDLFKWNITSLMSN